MANDTFLSNEHDPIEKYVPVMLMSPEVYDLPIEMGPLAEYVYRESGGGLGDHSGGLSRGFYSRGIPSYMLTPNYKTMFKNYSGLNEEEFIKKVHKMPEERIMLLSSPHFSRTNSIYSNEDSKNAMSAAHFQDLAIPMIKSINRNSGGRGILITNDQYAGGVSNAYCRKRGIPNIHIVHNLMELKILLSLYHYTDLERDELGIRDALFMVPGSNESEIYSHATAAKNADIILFVGPTFGKEAIGEKQSNGSYKGRFDDWDIFKNSKHMIEETKIKFDCGQVRFIPNGISPEQLPENQKYLPQSFGPETLDILSSKRANKIYPQDIDTCFGGRNPIDLFVPHRMNVEQKGIDKIIGSMDKILADNDDVRYVLVCDDKTSDRRFENAVRWKQNYSKRGRIILESFNSELSNRGYAETDITLFAHSYEPWGYAIAQTIAAGAFAVSPYNGGAVDMIRQFQPTTMNGNGFFYNGTTEDLISQTQEAINTVRELRKNADLANTVYRSMMTDIRYKFGADKMLDAYLEILDEVGHKFKLFTGGYKSFLHK